MVSQTNEAALETHIENALAKDRHAARLSTLKALPEYVDRCAPVPGASHGVNPACSNSAIDGELCAKTNANSVRIPRPGASLAPSRRHRRPRTWWS